MKKAFSKSLSWLLSVVMLFGVLMVNFSNLKVNATSDVVERAISWAVDIANDDSHGYSQTSRYGPDYDCSSLVISAFNNAGVSTGSASYTGNMISNFEANNFSWIPWSSIGNSSNLQRGDILLNTKYHTAIYIGNNQVVEAHGRSAADKAYDNRNVWEAKTLQGDQDGQEIRVTNYYWYSSGGWDGVLRYKFSDPPMNIWSDKNQYWYDISDTITIWAYADNANDFEIVIDDSVGNRLVDFSKMDGNSFSISASQLGGIGDYYYCIIAKNSAGGAQSEWYHIPVVGNPSYSNIRVSKTNYMVNDTVEISVDTICAKGQVIGIDKEGVGRVVTENCEPTFSILASQLGVGNYSAYFTVYNGSGWIDTQRVNFEITDVNTSLGREFSAMILNTYSWKPIQNCDDGKVRLATSSVYNMDSIVWNFKQNDNGSYTITSFKDGKVLDVTGGSGEDCTPIGCYIPNGTFAQQWFLIKRADGTYYLQALCTSGIMDVKNGVLEDGSELQTYTSNSSAAQIFSIYFINPNDDKTDYTITSTLNQIDMGQTTDVVIEGKVPYVYNYKFHIKTPIGEENIIDNKCNPVYKFTGTQLGKYTIWAEVTNPVSWETGSETNKYITITVKETHDYITTVVAPTCTEKGYTIHTCKNCNDSYKDTYTNATGHRYEETIVAPTTTEQGYTLHTCSVCKHSYKDNYTNILLSNNSTLSAETIKLGETITANAKATGGTGEYLYQVVYKQTTQSKWTTAQSYKANVTVTFKPANAVTYDVCVKVKDSNNTEVKKFFTVKVTSDKLKNVSTISAQTINLGSTVTVNAKATGSTGFYTYAVYYKQKAQTKWTTKQDFKANDTIAVKPAKATTYDICVKVKDDKGTIVKKYFTVNVTDFKNTSTLSATEIKLGNTVKVSCSATGSTGYYQYAVYYKKTSDIKWTTKQNYSSNNTVTIKPAKATTYDVCVKVKDNQDNVIKKYFSLTVK